MPLPLQPSQIVDVSGVASVQPTLSNSADELRPFRGLMVFAAGDVKFSSGDGNADTWTIPSGAVPFLIPVYMTRVWVTGTTVTAANLRGLV